MTRRLVSAGPRRVPARPRRVAVLSVHTSPLEQPGTGDAGGMIVYVVETSTRLAALGVEVEVFTRATRSDLPPVVEQGVRVSEIAPGMVRTEEFSTVRFGGDEERAAAVYAGVEPLTASDVADTIAWVASRPAHVNVDLVQLTPQQQAGVSKVVRR